MFAVLSDNWDLFSRGFIQTLKLFVISGIGCLILGTALAAARVSPVPALRWVGASYVNIVRNTPLTLIFAFFAFAVPKLQINIDYFPAACVALTLYTSAFVCEVVRSGVNTVSTGQAEAARALGMNFRQVLGLIVLPQAFRTIAPPLVSVFNAMLKNTTVAAGFSVFQSGSIPAYLAERGENQMIGLFWITMSFLILVIPLIVLQRFLERRWAVAR